MFSAFNEIFLMLLPFRGELVYLFVYFVETRFTFTAIKCFFFFTCTIYYVLRTY